MTLMGLKQLLRRTAMNKMTKSLSTHLLIAALCIGGLATPGTAPASGAASGKVKLEKKSATLSIVQDGAKIKKDKYRIRVTNKKGVKIKKTKYECKDKSIASVSKKGVITPKAAGKTSVTVKVKFRYKKKTKNKTLTFKVNINKAYRHILSGLTLKYANYATYVGAATGINPVYDTKVSVDDSFSAWDCLSMKVADPTVAGIGENGFIAGKKPGTTTVTISSTDDTKLSVTATIKVFATKNELGEKNDLYNTVGAEYLPAMESSLTEEEREYYTSRFGGLNWSQSGRIEYQKNINRKKIIATYTSAGKQPDNTPEDALNSILTTGQEMKNGGEAAEKAFIQTVKDKVTAPILAAGSVDELAAVSEDLEKRGITGLAGLKGFSLYRENDQYYKDVFEHKEPLPAEPTDISRVYIPKMSAPVNQAGYYGTTDKEKKTLAPGLSLLFKSLGYNDVSEEDVIKYLDFITEFSNEYYNPENTEYTKPISEVSATYPNLHVKEHLQKKGYKFSETDMMQVTAPGGFIVLNKYMADEKNLAVLKMYLIEAATYELLQYSRLSLKVSYEKNPEISEGDAAAQEKQLEEEYQKQMTNLEDLIPWDFDHIYTKTVYPSDFKPRFEKLVQEYRTAYHDAIAASEYGETFKTNMLKKIDNLKVDCLYPDDATYKKYELPYDLTTAGEGGNLADNLLRVRQYRADLECMTIGTLYGSMDWWYVNDDLFQSMPSTPNAYYDFSNNRCVFFHGDIGLNIMFYEDSGNEIETEVKNLGYLSTTIGHEMGHAFDNLGSMFDHTGKMVNPWGSDDSSVYNDKVNKLAQIYSSLVVYADRTGKKAYYHTGSKVVGEAMADLGGAEISVRIIKKKYPGRDDLIQKFYRYNAEQWMTTDSDNDLPEYAVNELLQDEHPVNRQRVNGVASMTDDFYRVFDVQETDAMYVAPEDRVRLW